MHSAERRQATGRRRVPRGGRRPLDTPGRHPRALVADSNDGARRPCVRYLDRFGFQVEEAVTGDAAVAVLERYHPQVAIAELTLPRDDEFQACVKAYGIPYIVTVTNDQDVIPAQAAAVLVKPFPLATLLEEVRRALSGGAQPGR